MTFDLFLPIIVLGIFCMTPPGHRLLNFVQFHIGYKVVKTQDEFIRVARERAVQSVVVYTVKYPSCIYDPPPITNIIGESTYTLEITAEMSRGRPVVYQEFPFRRFGSSNLFADADDRSKAALKLMLLGEKKMQELKELFPAIPVTLNGQRGPVAENILANLHRDARKADISV